MAEKQKEEKKKSPLANVPRTVLSWLKPCTKEDTLETLSNGKHSVTELMEVINIAKNVQKLAEKALKAKSGPALKEWKKKIEEDQKVYEMLEKIEEEKKKD